MKHAISRGDTPLSIKWQQAKGKVKLIDVKRSELIWINSKNHPSFQTELREQITHLESTKEIDSEKISVEVATLETRHEGVVIELKEQIRQHSVTICTMEERLNKVMKKNKDYQSEMSHMRETITGKEDVRDVM